MGAASSNGSPPLQLHSAAGSNRRYDFRRHRGRWLEDRHRGGGPLRRGRDQIAAADGQAAFATAAPRLLGQRWPLQRAWITARRETMAQRGRQARRTTGETRGGPRMDKPSPRLATPPPPRLPIHFSLGSDEHHRAGGQGANGCRNKMPRWSSPKPRLEGRRRRDRRRRGGAKDGAPRGGRNSVGLEGPKWAWDRVANRARG